METATKTKLPTFKGKPLIEIPEFIPQIGFLEGDFGRAFLEEYQGRLEADYNGSSVLNVLFCKDNIVEGSNPFAIVEGSNPFAVVLANRILREEGLRTATQADLEKALKTGALNLRGNYTYEDTGLVLRSEEDGYTKNTPLAKDLGSQVRARGIKFSPKNPVMIPLKGLELEKAYNDYGLTFKLREDSEVYESPILAKGRKFNSEDIDEKTGLPKKTGGSGNRTLYTRDSGLSRLYLRYGLDLGSDYGSKLGFSDDSGSVVVVGAGGTSPENLQEGLYSQISEKYQTQVEELNARRAKAEKAVREIMSQKK